MIKDLIAKLAPYRSGVVCDGLDKVSNLLCEELPFTVHEFATGDEVNGWTVPHKWECQTAKIWKQYGGGEVELIYDGNAHPLGVCAYSDSWIGGLGGEELKKHLYYADGYNDALIYHCDWWYKPWARNWGFSVTKHFYNSIDDKAAYHIELRTTLEAGTMKVLEYVLPGKSEQSIMLNAHDCHPGCANDDLSGCAVGIQVMRQMAERTNRKYTYRLLIAPEHFGSIFYLKRFGKNNIIGGIFLESLGTDGQLALQQSFTGESEIDNVLRVALRPNYSDKLFRQVVGNDETVWEAAGYEIPFPSVSRVPFPEYHTDKDNAALMSENSLQDASMRILDALVILDLNTAVQAKFTGLVCLSNPRYDLYKPMSDPSIPDRRQVSPSQREWNSLMDRIPRYFNGEMTILDMAEDHILPFYDVYQYVLAWRDKGLVEFVDLS